MRPFAALSAPLPPTVPLSRVAAACLGALLVAMSPVGAGAQVSADDVARRVDAVESQVIAWRRDLHAHPELGNREQRTGALIAEQLRSFGLEVHTGIAHTGVVAVLRGARPGKVVALRSDMDGLPVQEKVDLPFASHAVGEYQGKSVPVMHACGHDAHMAMLLGAAKVLAALRKEISGTIVFIFQPAEEGPPAGEEGGAALILKEWGDLPKPDAYFGIHVWPGVAGHLYVRPQGAMAAADFFKITIKGKQTHGAQPWAGIDSVTVGAQIVEGLNAVTARQLDPTKGPSVITVGQFNAGARANIVPETAELAGTIRTLDPDNLLEARRRVTLTAQTLAQAAGATADVEIREGAALTWNDPALTEAMLPSLRRAAGDANVEQAPVITASEDFAYYQKQAPGVFYFLGVNAEGVSAKDAAPNHSPYFFVNEKALATGVRAHVITALDYLERTAHGA